MTTTDTTATTAMDEDPVKLGGLVSFQDPNRRDAEGRQGILDFLSLKMVEV